jgi:hypothetical protein
MNSFNFGPKNKPTHPEMIQEPFNKQPKTQINIQTPGLTDSSTPTNVFQKTIKLQERKSTIEPPKESETRKKQGVILTNHSTINRTPAQIVNQIINEEEVVPAEIDCKISLNDETDKYFDSPLVKNIRLTPEEFEDLLMYVEQIQVKRRQEEKIIQEKKSTQLANKIAKTEVGKEFLESYGIVQYDQSGKWFQSIKVSKDDDDQDELNQVLNFYNPQHSWILENWLSNQSVSWVVKRYSKSEDEIVYQISFGFPDQTFLEAEGPTREGAIFAVAEDLFS